LLQRKQLRPDCGRERQPELQRKLDLRFHRRGQWKRELQQLDLPRDLHWLLLGQLQRRQHLLSEVPRRFRSALNSQWRELRLSDRD
jgi:hypothetical protein